MGQPPITAEIGPEISGVQDDAFSLCDYCDMIMYDASETSHKVRNFQDRLWREKNCSKRSLLDSSNRRSNYHQLTDGLKLQFRTRS